MDKSREQFEAWARSETRLNLDRTNYALTAVDEQQYIDHDTNLAWMAWQASRAAVEIELPPTTEVHPLGPSAAKVFCELHKNTVTECAKAIRAAGLKIKGE
ncbi:hypothetical protein CBR20_19925 [Cronobacter sakazakii]|uniref:hypothetical protein n=1 Tax=Cronobacter sakazakii TaxID=28141 RepID=UPI00084E314F|nr:hypothetical protein [Cronobacter sakazakii]PUW50075.1 hypothetical protein AUM98_04565 [Cronobacter sakazakii]PUW56687.1 hypothetical protein CBR20_19925 [Cronobacter sakazakii]PUW69863.1 hypothetical protein CBR17_12175 [Cronobacter sakazakii]PUW71996.1 hypothetical protein CBR16_15400 [Cronobacter sakazakii]PUW72630.1 hypothetical protein CBR18_09145 [Cronobacter sakazakii]